MQEKRYERTGIKEYSNKRKKQRVIEEQRQQEQTIQKAIARGKYKDSRKDCYDLSSMNHQKEYRKVKNLLDDYKEIANLYNENIETLIFGYRDYFDAHGEDMNAMALRDFRKGILSTLSNSKKALVKDSSVEKIEKQGSSREEMILNFCINHHLDLQQRGLDMGMFFSLIDFLAQNGAPAKDGDDMAGIRQKVKSIHNELKDS